MQNTWRRKVIKQPVRPKCWTAVVMTWRQSKVTLTHQCVCLSVTSLNDNVTWSIDLYRCMKPCSSKESHVHMKKALVLIYPFIAQRRLIRLGECPGWSESSLGAHSFCWFCSEAAQIIFQLSFTCRVLSKRLNQNMLNLLPTVYYGGRV